MSVERRGSGLHVGGGVQEGLLSRSRLLLLP